MACGCGSSGRDRVATSRRLRRAARGRPLGSPVPYCLQYRRSNPRRRVALELVHSRRCLRIETLRLHTARTGPCCRRLPCLPWPRERSTRYDHFRSQRLPFMKTSSSGRSRNRSRQSARSSHAVELTSSGSARLASESSRLRRRIPKLLRRTNRGARRHPRSDQIRHFARNRRGRFASGRGIARWSGRPHPRVWPCAASIFHGRTPA
jgi:hypothetical protein